MENNVNHKNKLSNFTLRFLSTIILLPVIIWITFGGGFLYLLLLLVAAYIASKEYSYMCMKWSFGIDSMCFITFVCLSVTAFYMDSLLVGFICLFLGAYLTYLAVKLRKKTELQLKSNVDLAINSPWILVVGVLYVGFSFSCLAYLHKYDPYNFTILWIFGLVVCNDISAYIFGSLIKGKKLAPSISPGKTWSGFVCAIICNFLVSYMAASFFNIKNILDISVFGAVVAVVAHIGDLLESALKRYVKVKDSGNLIPGHGGILDRVDGLMLVAIFSFVVSIVIGRSILLI